MKLLIFLMFFCSLSFANEMTIEEFANLRGLNPDEKEILEKKFREYQDLPSNDKERVHRKFKKWKDMPIEKQNMIREMYSNPEKRQRFRKRLRRRRQKN